MTGPCDERRMEMRPRRSRAGMPERRRRTPERKGVLGLLVVAAIAGCGGPGDAGDAASEDDHTHGGGDVVTLWTDSLELFMEYPPQVAERQSEPWAVHLTWLEDWEPVREGGLALRLRGPGGADMTVEADAPVRPGLFTPAPTPTAPGTWRIDMVLSARGREYPIPVGQMRVFESEEALPHVEEEASGAIGFLMEQQWEIPFRMVEATEREIPASVRVSGELVAPTGALARISAPVVGLVLARGPMPAPGDPVRRGQTLALLAPADAENSFASLRARVERLEREEARAERLYEAEAIPEKRLVEARHELGLARAALEAIGGPGTADEAAGTDAADAYRYRLRSPIDGVLSERHLAPGQRVEAGAPAFTVVDPRTLWLRLHIPAVHAGRAGTASGASFTVEGGARVHRAERVVSVGNVIDAETRTLPALLSVPNPEGALKVGMLADSRLLLGDAVRGVAIPSAAIQDEEGLKTAYVQLGGETFERRVLELGPTDGEWTIVRSGIESGEKVVTLGAYQVRLAALGGEPPATGHGHPH